LSNQLRVAINAQIAPGSGTGGLETVLRELTALGELDDGPEEYVFIGPWHETDWLQPLLNSRQRIIRGPQAAPPVEWRPGRLDALKRALGPLRPAARRISRTFSRPAQAGRSESLPVSDGFYESLGCDVIHFPFQSYVRCALPSVYNPHDFQHLHYPEFFEPGTINWRRWAYPAACRAAHTVVVASRFVKQDIVRHCHVAQEKIQVIPWSPPPVENSTDGASDASRIREKYQLTEKAFALYPAMTWEHKNHIRLLEALASLRDRHALRVRLVCTGDRKSFWPQIEKRMLELGLQEQVKFTGLVPYEDMRAFYRAAQFVIVPTLFEAASAPLFEAWQHHVPIACSAVTSLPEQAADAALLFDPLSVDAIADAVASMATDKALRASLQQRGAKRLSDFSLERTAKSYRAVYRSAAGRVLNEEDRWLLNCGLAAET
jgi:glycosyltransferase involved in cell wall biosynthesis